MARESFGNLCQQHNMMMMICIDPIPLPCTRCDTGSIFEAEFNRFQFRVFFLPENTKFQAPSQRSYFSTAGGRIVGCILFPSVLALCEMKTTLFRIWSLIVMPIFYDNNHCITSTSIFIHNIKVVLKRIRKRVPTDKIRTYCSLNKQYMKEVHLQKISYLIMIVKWP